MDIRLNIKGYIDRRTEDLHARYSVIEQRRFGQRVAANPKERERLDREFRAARSMPALLRRQAD